MTLKLLCVKKSFLVIFCLLSSSSYLHTLISLSTFPYNLRTTDQLPKMPNPLSHQPPSCLCLNSLKLLSLFFHCLSRSQICKAIHTASNQIFSRLPPFHHKSYQSYTFSWPSNPFSASLATVFPLSSAFPCSIKDATCFLILHFLFCTFCCLQFLIFLFTNGSICSFLLSLRRCVFFRSPIILHSDLSLLHLILKLHSTKTKQKAEKRVSTSKALIRAPYILQQSLASKEGKQTPFR